MKKYRYVWVVLMVAIITAVVFAVVTSSTIKTQDELLFESLSDLFDFPEISGVNVTRSEALHMLLCVIGEDDDASGATFESHFTDVSGTKKKEADYAYKKGIVFGDGDNRFFPDNEATLGEMLTMVLRVLGENPSDVNEAFALADSNKIYPDSASNSLRFLLSQNQCGEILWNLLNSEKPGADGATFAEVLEGNGTIPSGAVDSIGSIVNYDFNASHDVATRRIYESAAESTTKPPETTKPVETTTPEVTTEGGWSPIWKP